MIFIEGWHRMSNAQRAREIKGLAAQSTTLSSDAATLIELLADIVEDLAIAEQDRKEAAT